MTGLSRRATQLATVICTGLLSCSATSPLAPRAPRANAPQSEASDPLSLPPPASLTTLQPFPQVHHLMLPSGLAVDVVEHHGLPLVAVRLVLDAGQAQDGLKPGRARLCAQLLKAGGAGALSPLELVQHADALGSFIEVETGPDATELAMSVAASDLESAVELLTKVVQQPRLDALEFDRLKQRELERTQSQMLSDADWQAHVVLFKRLFGSHPYAHFDALPSELSAISLADCQSWFRSEVVPSHAELVIVGDLDVARGEAAARRSFQAGHGHPVGRVGWKGVESRTQRKIWLIDRPGLVQSEVFVAGLGPQRGSASWPAVAVENQILGGPTSGRLFQDVREKRSLAYRTGSSLLELKMGRVPLILSAGIRVEKTSETLQALLAQGAALTKKAPEDAEVTTAVRYLTDSFLFRTEQVGDLAKLVAKLHVLGLPEGYYDSYRERLASVDPGSAFAAALQTLDLWSPLVVIVGDAARVEQSLRSFGDVAVLNPREEFATSRELSRL